MKACFYDIESLSNAFTLCNFKPHENALDMFVLVDDPALFRHPSGRPFVELAIEKIYKENTNFTGKVNMYDLRLESSNIYFTQTFGLSDAWLTNDKTQKSSYPEKFRLVCDTDEGYDDDTYPYLMGYNSANYDTTMIAMYLHEVWTLRDVARPGSKYRETECKFACTTAKLMRQYNDELFSPMFKKNMPDRLGRMRLGDNTWSEMDYKDRRYKIRKNMLLSGRHLDVAKLNEKMQHVALKRVVGMLGGQIKESDKLDSKKSTLETCDELLDLIAYNVSDCVNLYEYPFKNKVYQGKFELKKQMLKDYPELIYEQKEDEYAPDIDPAKVRRDRLTIDSTSAQFSQKSLCPYGHLTDSRAVSYLYPAKESAEEQGIPQINVLEEVNRKMWEMFSAYPEDMAKWKVIYDYYKRIEGRNFNDSGNYRLDWGDEALEPEVLALEPKVESCMRYFNGDGSESTCFVNFSTGGIHGAEANIPLYEYDCAVHRQSEEDLAYVRSVYPDPVDLKKAKNITLPDGAVFTAGKFLETGATLTSASYKQALTKKPELFVTNENDGRKLNPKYVITSFALMNHEDFKSYYPNLLRQMRTFWNKGLGYDRYGRMFDQKEEFGTLMKDKTKSEEERGLFGTMREGTKLVLNTASGTADAKFDSEIRMNNNIISMRIIGQLFTFLIGQIQTYHGARVPSTNTDGLFTVMEKTLNNTLLEKASKDIHVLIEPEDVYLISKDANNRLEVDNKTGKVVNFGGGDLAAYKGPSPEKTLAHPAIIDWALGEYLYMAALGYEGLSMDKPFDRSFGMRILKKSKEIFEPAKYLNMYQNLLASSTGSMTYVFGTKVGDPEGKPVILQHYNRAFIMKDGTEGCMCLQQAAAVVINASTQAKRKKENERPVQNDPVALIVLDANGLPEDDIPYGREARLKKISKMETTWHCYIQNRDLKLLPDEEKDFIMNQLDLEKYLDILEDTFNSNWMNETPPPLRPHAWAPPEKPKAEKPKKESGAKKKSDKKGDGTDMGQTAGIQETATQPGLPWYAQFAGEAQGLMLSGQPITATLTLSTPDGKTATLSTDDMQRIMGIMAGMIQ